MTFSAHLGGGRSTTKKGGYPTQTSNKGVSGSGTTKLPKLSEQVKQQMQEANKLDFPMARFMFKDMEFPDT